MMNEIIWKGVSKSANMYLDSERNSTADYLARTLRDRKNIDPKDYKQNCIRKINLGKSVNPITRSEITKELTVVDDPKRVVPLMYYYAWSKTDIQNIKEWNKKNLYTDIELPTDEELDALM